jgi:capsular polysaccharide biosynthesis protein
MKDDLDLSTLNNIFSRQVILIIIIIVGAVGSAIGASGGFHLTW